MIKLPARPDGQWTVVQKSDKLPDIVSTRNLTFDNEGYVRLSKPTVSLYSEVDDADFGYPVNMGPATLAGQFMIATNEKQFQLDMYNSGAYGVLTVTEDAGLNTPDNTSDGSYRADAVHFNETFVYANPTDRKLYTHPLGSLANDWTIRDTSATVETGSLVVCNFASKNNIAVGNDNNVDVYSTSYTAGTALVIPEDFKVTGIAYNNGYVGITTHAAEAGRCYFFVWDGATAAANYSIEVPSATSFLVTPYGGTFAFVDGNGVVYRWSPGTLTPIAVFPVYMHSGVFITGGYGSVPQTPLNHSVVTEGELIHFNLSSVFSSATEDQDIFITEQHGGIWTYDPSVGLYHRHALTGTKVVVDTIATTSVNTSTDTITVAAAPETGTPVRYSDGNSTAIAGLTNKTVYYTIKTGSTTVQLAETYNDAINGTEIDLTGTGNNSQTLQFYLKTDFGQSYKTDKKQGMIYIPHERDITSDLYYQEMFYGSDCSTDTTTEYSVFGFVLQDTENRGYFITSKFMSQQLQDDWQKIFIKHSPLVNDTDKIVVKYRIDNNKPLTRIKSASDGTITWSDNNTFTTTDTQWANVMAGDEVEFIQGTGSGYLAHVSSISESSGTYTVNIDETIKNLTAAKTGRAVASRWKKLTTLDNGIISNDDGYSEITVGVKSKQIQFKIELRGEDVEVEEILVAHQLHKPVA